MNVFVFGNSDIESDSLPLRILPHLQKEFPNIVFETLDPNEDWNIPEKLVIIDTVVGIKEVTTFDSLDAFESAPRVSLHDFDAYANLRLIAKLGKLKKIKIIGIPPTLNEKDALDQIASAITTT